MKTADVQYILPRFVAKLLNLKYLIFRTDISRKEVIRRLLYTYFAVTAIPFMTLFAVIKIVHQDYQTGFILLMGASIHGLIVFYSFRKYQDTHRLMIWNIWFYGIMFLVLLIKSSPSGYMALWLFLFPPFSYVMLNLRDAAICNAVFLIAAAIIVFLQDLMTWPLAFETAFQVRFILTLNTVSVLSYVAELLRHRYELSMIKQQKKLVAEKEKLAAAKQIVEDASRTKTDFLGNMSHELRTPLHHIIGFSELIVEKNVGEINALQEEYLQDILLSARHLLTLIDDTLDLSTIYSGELELDIQEMNLKNLLLGCMEKMKSRSKNTSLHLKFHYGDAPETIKADQGHITKAFMHLLDNALKYSSDGQEVEVTVSRMKVPSKTPRVKLPKPAWDCIEIAIKDHGIGIEEKDLKRIFLPFEQVESSASRKFSGTGLGLTMAKMLVERHKGRVWAESDGLGGGATFRVLLPLS